MTATNGRIEMYVRLSGGLTDPLEVAEPRCLNYR